MIKCEMIPIIQNVRVRKNKVDIKGLQETLRAYKKTYKQKDSTNIRKTINRNRTLF